MSFDHKLASQSRSVHFDDEDKPEVGDVVSVVRISKGHLENGHPLDEEEQDENETPLINNIQPVPLSPFEKIKLETDRRTAHGHPVILPTEYGGFGPVYDILALFQNAVKKQILVAYNTLEGLLRYKFAVGNKEAQKFFDWFDVFCDCTLTFLAIEEEEVFPFLENNGAMLQIEVTKIERMKMKDKLAVQLQTIDKQRSMFRMLPPGEIVPRITTLVPAFLRVVLDYYDVQAGKLPRAIVDANIDMTKAISLRSRVMRALKTRPSYGMHIIFMSHWLTGIKLKGWKNDFLGLIEALKYEQWSRNFAHTYQSIPGKLLNKLMTETALGDATDGSSSNLSFYLGRKKNAYKV